MADKASDSHEWLARAAMDLDSAIFLFNNRYPKPLEVIGSLCQQCAEKSVKGVYLALDNYEYPFPKIHEVAALLEQIKNYVKYDKSFPNKGSFMRTFKQSVYPDNEIDIDEEMVKQGLIYAAEIHKWAKEVIYEKKHIVNKGLSR